MIGRVVSAKLKQTVTVLVERKKIHPLYKKAFLRSKKYLVDDPIGVMMGDLVELEKIAPLSKRKHFRVIKVVGKRLHEITEEKLKEHAKGVIAQVMPDEKEESEDVKTKSKNSEKKIVMDNSTEEPKSRKRGRTELSKK